ncbi:MAG: hypothetical protein IPJ32_18120 [Sphingobacteriaceae bacterium]|nr:hypothetical protein [Sphingobacteriaceae bacterium]
MWNSLSSYGAAIAADSILRFIEKVRNEDLPDVSISKIELSKTARGADADLSTTLNLIWPIENDIMAYPKLVFNKNGKAKLKILGIGDSFYYGIEESTVPTEAFEEHSFWYYNKSIISNGPSNQKKTSDISLINEISRNDVIVILANETNLKDFGWGFIDQAWGLYFGSTESRISYYIDKIKNDPAWFDQVKQKATQNNKSLDAQLRDDANYMVGLERRKTN